MKINSTRCKTRPQVEGTARDARRCRGTGVTLDVATKQQQEPEPARRKLGRTGRSDHNLKPERVTSAKVKVPMRQELRWSLNRATAGRTIRSGAP